MSVRLFTADRLPELLDFVEACSSWGYAGRDLGRLTFQQTLQRPGFEPETNCLLLESEGRIQGYCLVIHEVKIGRTVLEPYVIPELAGTPSEQDLILKGLERTQTLGGRLVQVCLPHPSPTADFLIHKGFAQVRTYLNMVWRREAPPSVPLPEGFTLRPFKIRDAALPCCPR